MQPLKLTGKPSKYVSGLDHKRLALAPAPKPKPKPKPMPGYPIRKGLDQPTIWRGVRV